MNLFEKHYNLSLIAITFTVFLSFNKAFCNNYDKNQLESINKQIFIERTSNIKNIEIAEIEKIKESIENYEKETKDTNTFLLLSTITKNQLSIRKQELTKTKPVEPKFAEPKFAEQKTKQEDQKTNYFYDLYKNIKYNAIGNSEGFIAKIEIEKNNLNTDKNRIEENKNNIINNSAPSSSPTTRIKNYTKPTIKESISEIIKDKDSELCLFGECYCTPRQVRSQFEKKVVNNNQLKNLNTINYLGFAPGDLLSDLKILTDLIINKNKKINNIYLIDYIYNSKNFTGKKYIMDVIPTEKSLHIIQLAQFIKILSEFQNQPIKLMIFENLQSYISQISYENRADLATMIDLEAKHFKKKGDSIFDNKYNILINGLKKGGILCSLLKYSEYANDSKQIAINGNNISLKDISLPQYSNEEEGTYEATAVREEKDSKFSYIPSEYKENFYIKP